MTSPSGSFALIDPSTQQTNDLVHLFSTTLHSLASDAAAVRQASSLGRVLEEFLSKNDSSTLCDRFLQMEALVSSLEEKVIVLRQIVSEEKRSLTKFETTLYQEAHEQAALMEQMIHSLQDHEMKQRPSLDRVKEETDDQGDSDCDDHDHDHDQHNDNDNDNDNDDYCWNTSAKYSSRRDSVDPRTAPSTASRHVESENLDPISLPRIVQAEFEDYRADNHLGPRISLLDLNQALEEIEQLCQVQQHAARLWKRKQPPGTSSGALQRRYEYLQKRQQLPADDTAMSVTEQELRENCPFFRHGESTARATLSLLCSLKRLKQVPQKNRQVIYHLLL